MPQSIIDLNKQRLAKFKGQKRSKIAELLLKDQTAKSKRKRELSEHVQPRWYRAPEIILCDNEYWFTAEIWSLGCIFGEMILYSNINNDKKFSSFSTINTSADQTFDDTMTLGAQPAKPAKASFNDRVLFKGKSCYPLSPSSKGNISRKD